MLMTEKPGIEEAYSTASNTSDLTVRTEARGAADVLIAAGWSPTRLGAALLRLHSEWDRAEKPPKPTLESIRSLIGTHQRPLPGVRAEDQPKLPLSAAGAKVYTSAWYRADMAMLCRRLTSLPGVTEQIAIKHMTWQTSAPAAAAAMASRVVRYWLDQTCPACHGTQWEVVEGTARHSGKACRGCGGSGVAEVPHGQDGRRLLNHMDASLEAGRGFLQRALSSRRHSRDHFPDVREMVGET